MTNLNDPRIAVVCGGSSAEASVSRVSGRGVAEALRATFSSVVVVELDENVGQALQSQRTDVVFPVLHGPPGEDGTFQGFLETLHMPYVGSDVHTSASAMDKTLAKHRFRDAGLPVAPDMIVTRQDDRSRLGPRIQETLGTRVVVKPSRQGSALGVAFPTNIEELDAALVKAFEFDERVLIEERIEGKEITVGILERQQIEAFPVIEVRTPAGAWYDFEHRYTPGLSEHLIPAPLPPAQYSQVQELAKRAHIALGCRDLSRVDFVVPEIGDPIVLEVNTLPGMTPTSLYPDGAKAAGITFVELVKILIRRALQRGANKSLERTRER